MQNQKKLILVSALILVSVLFALLTFKPHAQNKTQEQDDAPTLNYETEIQNTATRERKEKNKHFNSRGNPNKKKQIFELPPGVEPLPSITHWWVGLPPLPVSQSTAVIFAEVVDGKAYLSEDKTAVYSEFLVRVDEVYKNTGSYLNFNSLISASRSGGNVRFNSGRLQKYKIHRQGVLKKGGRYLFFLRQVGDDNFLIITGYRLLNGKVMPIDGGDQEDPRSALPFAQYAGVEESRLLQDLRMILQSGSSQGGFTQ